jgi:hypothetical protein
MIGWVVTQLEFPLAHGLLTCAIFVPELETCSHFSAASAHT